jgi:hypothetical protein
VVRGSFSFDNTVVGVLLETGIEVNVSLTKRYIPLEVGETSIERHDIPFVQGNVWCDGLFVCSTVGVSGMPAPLQCRGGCLKPDSCPKSIATKWFQERKPRV